MAHGFKPVVFVGQKGLTPSLGNAMEEALDSHELIKVRFIDFKEKDEKNTLAKLIEKNHRAELVGVIGHTAIFFREHHDPQNRKIKVPKRNA